MRKADRKLRAREAPRAQTVAERVRRWLDLNRGAFCDACIARELELGQGETVNRATRALAARSNFLREQGTCSICGAFKKVIGAV